MPQLFDDKELLERVDNDWDFLAETVQMLNTDGRSLISEVRQAAASGDAPALGRSAHTLKGMISNFCSPATQASAFEVEKMGKTGDLSSAPAAVDSLAAQLDALIAELNSFLATRS
jgi:two-component system sensor histidine kinase/response regulator